MTPTPHYFTLDDPFTCNVHYKSSPSVGLGINFIVKSAKLCELINPLDSNRILNSDNSTDHPIIRSVRSSLAKSFIIHYKKIMYMVAVIFV